MLLAPAGTTADGSVPAWACGGANGGVDGGPGGITFGPFRGAGSISWGAASGRISTLGSGAPGGHGRINQLVVVRGAEYAVAQRHRLRDDRRYFRGHAQEHGAVGVDARRDREIHADGQALDAGGGRAQADAAAGDDRHVLA